MAMIRRDLKGTPMFKPSETAYQVARRNFLAYAAAHDQGCASDEDRATAREQLASTDWLAAVIDQLDCLRNHQDQLSDRNAHTRALRDFFAMVDQPTNGDEPIYFPDDSTWLVKLIYHNADRWRRQIAECGAGFNPLLISSDIVVLQKKIDRELFDTKHSRPIRSAINPRPASRSVSKPPGPQPPTRQMMQAKPCISPGAPNTNRDQPTWMP
jgi:hypothetical protein